MGVLFQGTSRYRSGKKILLNNNFKERMPKNKFWINDWKKLHYQRTVQLVEDVLVYEFDKKVKKLKKFFFKNKKGK